MTIPRHHAGRHLRRSGATASRAVGRNNRARTGARRRAAGRRRADTRRLARREPVRSHRAAPRRHRVVDVDGLAAPVTNGTCSKTQKRQTELSRSRLRPGRGQKPRKAGGSPNLLPLPTREQRSVSHTIICGMRPSGRLRFVVHRSPIARHAFVRCGTNDRI